MHAVVESVGYGMRKKSSLSITNKQSIRRCLHSHEIIRSSL